MHNPHNIDFRNINNVLITKLRFHDDVLLTTPVISVLPVIDAYLRLLENRNPGDT